MDYPKLFLERDDQRSLRAQLRNEGTENITRALSLTGRLQALWTNGEVTFDFNGHHKNRKTSPKVPKDYTHEFRRNFGHEEQIIGDLRPRLITETTEDHLDLLERLLTCPGNSWVELPDVCPLSCCFECGRRMKFLFNGGTIKVAEECEHPEGAPPLVNEIDVPSGMLVFCNYLRGCPDPDMNAAYNQGLYGILEWKHRQDHFAKLNVAQVFCGNSCPAVSQDGDKLYVGNPVYGDEEEIALPGDRVAGVTTDLWEWSASDRATAELYDELVDDYHEQVEVVPGRYRVTQLYHTDLKHQYSAEDEPHIFATIELVDPSGGC